MCGDQALNAATTPRVPGRRTPHQHQFQRTEQAVRDNEIIDVASVVKGDEYFVGQAATLAQDSADRAGGGFVQCNQCSLPFVPMRANTIQLRMYPV